jgi:hypothetical protein
MVKVANPCQGMRTHVTLSQAKRLVKLQWARHDCGGRLVMLKDFATMIRRDEIAKDPTQYPSLAILNVTEAGFYGADARPGMPVLPPSPEVLAKMGNRSKRVPLRPPVKPKALVMA